MGLALEKCCCFIPLRLGTFFIAIWFCAVYLLYTASGFLAFNPIVVYSGQVARPWYYINLLFSVFICIGGLCGIIGSTFASRRFSKAFSIIAWINVALSILIYVISLALICVHRQDVIDSCRVVGFVSINNSRHEMTVSKPSDQTYYSPVHYTGLLTEHAATEAQCSAMTKTFIIAFGVVVFIVQLIQIYFASVVGAYAARLRSGARHHRLHDQQIKDFEESRFHMSTVY
ncbi:uncharacterized protein B0P05DRAFT_545878 [Gilbertella persicaria]|uniref:Uncharacterized protein n=1 Tax=Rhizopus stolonifer TaxID=4846 RepID=A0A367K1W3_RHIST|nr:uncharacterized protein B0P05DRAFT_545878 [Gilbertella persicaria]KAI8076442.1 hypothetical protein B0P05DRAFT_545878 [Gilbertella persicaria]RCH96193.1 hypothetical protein CU098_004039 [Rhizopus stolonifer]